MRKKLIYLFLLCFLSVYSAPSAHAMRERISDFHSDIIINIDRTIEVAETIEVYSTGDQIRHGITRDLPTHYRDTYGTWQKRKYTIISTRLDSQPIEHTVESYMNGIIIKIQNPGVRIPPGKHTFTITYKTDRQLGFHKKPITQKTDAATHNTKNTLYKEFTELTWNVTGTKRQLPIDHASASIQFPTIIPKNTIHYEAYTGNANSKNSDYTAYFTPDGNLFFQTTQPLGIGGNITVVATWPAGYITPPTPLTKLYYFLTDNLLILWFLLSICILCWYSIYARQRAKKNIGSLDDRPIIPQFYPPNNFGPDDLFFLVHKKYSPMALTARVVDLAVRGFLRIEQQTGLFSSGYILTKQPADEAPTPTQQEDLVMRAFFTRKDTLVINKKYNPAIETANRLLKNHIYKTVSIPYISQQTTLLSIASILVTLFFAISLAIVYYSYQHNETDLLILGIIGFCYMLYMLFLNKSLRLYTREGDIIKKEIDGFALFLKTTEQDRIKLVGTPPTRTPELYEKYLPYAIALGVEQQWSKQFAPLFASLKEQGQPYQPRWVPVGQSLAMFNASTFSSSLASSLSQTISSSTTPPGSQSSSGGRGSSGSGGGGGGVGGI